MATNPPKNDDHRNGAVKKRSQIDKGNGTWTKRDKETGEFMDNKAGKKFKGVRKEK